MILVDTNAISEPLREAPEARGCRHIRLFALPRHPHPVVTKSVSAVVSVVPHGSVKVGLPAEILVRLQQAELGIEQG